MYKTALLYIYVRNPVWIETTIDIWPMDLNIPVFATGVRIFRASNDVGPCVHMNTRKKKHKVRNKMVGYCYISYYCRFPFFWKINGWNALTLWTPISCCAPGLLSYSYYFAYICNMSKLSINLFSSYLSFYIKISFTSLYT